MTGEQLLAEGQRLARPCVYLRSSGTEFAGIWGGTGVVPSEDGPYRHWLSIDSKQIPGGETFVSGWMSVYSNEDDCVTGFVAVGEARRPPSDNDGLRLYAHPDSSLPPLDAVFKFGSSEVVDWLESNNWKSDWEYNDNFPDREPTHFYQRRYQSQLPLFDGTAHAVLGGWHMPWPEADWGELVNKQLIAWTFAESEPWIEVWREEGRYRVLQRIT